MELAMKFEKELEGKMLLAKKQCKYNPTRFNQMLLQYGGVETAKRLIHDGMNTGHVSSGFTTLACFEGRPDLTLEESVCKAEYQSLFTDDEISWCKSLLGK